MAQNIISDSQLPSTLLLRLHPSRDDDQRRSKQLDHSTKHYWPDPEILRRVQHCARNWASREHRETRDKCEKAHPSSCAMRYIYENDNGIWRNRAAYPTSFIFFANVAATGPITETTINKFVRDQRLKRDAGRSRDIHPPEVKP